MTASKFTTTPSPIEVVEKVNAVIDDVTTANTDIANKLDKTEKAASATTADSAATLSATLPISKGGTGATDAQTARTNLGVSTVITGASISGKVITLTFVDGTTTTLTTQDTIKYGIPNYAAGVNITSSLCNSPYSWTPTADGVIKFHTNENKTWCIDNTASGITDLTNTTMILNVNGGSSIWTDYYVIVGKGDTIYCTGDRNSSNHAVFYPFK